MQPKDLSVTSEITGTARPHARIACARHTCDDKARDVIAYLISNGEGILRMCCRSACCCRMHVLRMSTSSDRSARGDVPARMPGPVCRAASIAPYPDSLSALGVSASERFDGVCVITGGWTARHAWRLLVFLPLRTCAPLHDSSRESGGNARACVACTRVHTCAHAHMRTRGRGVGAHAAWRSAVIAIQIVSSKICRSSSRMLQ